MPRPVSPWSRARTAGTTTSPQPARVLRRGAAGLAAAALLTACTGGGTDVPEEVPTPVEAEDADEPTGDALQRITELEAISLRGLELPEVPDGLDPVDVRTAADTVRALAVDAFTNRTLWDQSPTSEVQRTHLAIAGPTFAEQVETSPLLADGPPTAQLFVSLFDAEAQPVELPVVVSADWQVTEAAPEDVDPGEAPAEDDTAEDGAEEGSAASTPLVTLEVHAVYYVGDVDEPRIVLMRRTIGIGGNDLTRLDAPKTWLVDTDLIGADECAFYTDGFVRPTEEDVPAAAYLRFLEEVDSDEQDAALTAMTTLEDLRAEACS